jgi:hypothetical protein
MGKSKQKSVNRFTLGNLMNEINKRVTELNHYMATNYQTMRQRFNAPAAKSAKSAKSKSKRGGTRRRRS